MQCKECSEELTIPTSTGLCTTCSTCLTCSNPVIRPAYYDPAQRKLHGYCEECRAKQFSSSTREEQIRYRLVEIHRTKVQLHEQLNSLEKENRLLLAELSPAPNTSAIKDRKFPCSCGRIFLFYLERSSHISQEDSPMHRENGEIINGKHVWKLTNVVGEPIFRDKRKSIPADELPDDLF